MLLLVTSIINSLIALFVIVLHYEVLYKLNHIMSVIKHIHARYKVLIAVGVIFIAHIIEIWVFAIAYYLMLKFPNLGKIIGTASEHGSLLDSAYLSFVTFTTVGYGDIVVDGYLRYLTGVEALTGLILITWSASFLFIEMQKYWGSEHSK